MQPEMQPRPHTPAAAVAARKKRARWIRESRIGTFILLVGCALLIAALALWLWSSTGAGESSQVNTKEYQAVFLTNGQVYFGKINKLNNEYLTLTNVFYLQSPSTSSSTTSPQPKTSSNLTLVKLGISELHAPEDKMVINQSQVSFWENLKDSSKVVSAIGQYYANPSAANSSSTVQSGTSSTGTSTTGQ